MTAQTPTTLENWAQNWHSKTLAHTIGPNNKMICALSSGVGKENPCISEGRDILLILLYNDTAPKMHWNEKVSLVGGGSMTYEDLSYTGYTATRKKRSVSA